MWFARSCCCLNVGGAVEIGQLRPVVPLERNREHVLATHLIVWSYLGQYTPLCSGTVREYRQPAKNPQRILSGRATVLTVSLSGPVPWAGTVLTACTRVCAPRYGHHKCSTVRRWTDSALCRVGVPTRAMSLSKAVRWRWSSLACMMNWIC